LRRTLPMMPGNKTTTSRNGARGCVLATRKCLAETNAAPAAAPAVFRKPRRVVPNPLSPHSTDSRPAFPSVYPNAGTAPRRLRTCRNAVFEPATEQIVLVSHAKILSEPVCRRHRSVTKLMHADRGCTATRTS